MNPVAFLAVTSGVNQGTVVPVESLLVIGRECRGVDLAHRYVINDDHLVSRSHLELHVDVGQDQAWVVDTSTNGTRVNGRRIERFTRVPIRPGDRVAVGDTEFEFRSGRFEHRPTADKDKNETVRRVQLPDMAMVVGDILSFSTIAEYTPDSVLMENIERLYGGLRSLLSAHSGTLSNYVGDAFFATWEIGTIPDATAMAVRFALEAAGWVRSVAPSLGLRDPNGQPIRVGWGVAAGPAAVSSITGALVSVLGDATNVAFRLSGVAGRNGWSEVVVTKEVHNRTAELFSYSAPAEVEVKGRSALVTVYEAAATGTPWPPTTG